MENAEKNSMLSGLALIRARNSFYKEKYRTALIFLLILCIIIGLLIGLLSYFFENRRHPVYFATDDAGQLIQDIPIHRPNASLEQVSQWVVTAIESAYSYDFVNFRAQLQNSQQYFTPYGWLSYIKALEISLNLSGVQDRKLVGIAKVAQSPKLLAQGPLGPYYAWKFQIPVLMTYLTPPYATGDKFSNAQMLEVIVRRRPLLDSYSGLGIEQIVGSLV